MDGGQVARLVVNGEAVEVDVAPTTRLVDVLRDRLGLTGAKDACGRGDCGACTVLVGDRAVLACLTLAVRVAEPVRTVEGIVAEAAGLRRAFADRGGLQCGYCTPGLIVRCHEMLEAAGAGEDDSGAVPAGTTAAGEAAVRAGLSGNFCRCTGYNGVVAAVAESLSR